jgi:flagella synthesis protein FlgN
MKTSLENAIASQLVFLKELKALLEQELHLISSREPEKLMQLLHSKQELLDKIEAQDSAVDTLYKRALAKTSIPESCDALLQNCKQVLFECKYLTQINAKSVEQGQLRLVHLRNFMMELRAKESITYDRSGRTNGDSSSKGISA